MTPDKRTIDGDLGKCARLWTACTLPSSRQREWIPYLSKRAACKHRDDEPALIIPDLESIVLEIWTGVTRVESRVLDG